MAKKRGVLKVKEEKIVKKERKEYEFEILKDSIKEKALLAAEAQVYKLNKDGLVKEPILLQIGTLLPTTKERDLTRRMVPLPNKLRSVKNTTILLVTKDPVDEFRIPLTEKDSATEEVFADIVGYKKFKTMVGTTKKALKTYHEYDMIVTDNRLHVLLPNSLQSTIFCKSSANFPLMVQMATQSADVQQVQQVKLKKMEKKKDNRVEPKYVLNQIRAWCKNTTFTPSTGTILSIIVGYEDMSGLQIIENIDAALAYLTDKKFRPIGGIISTGIEGVLDLHLRANDKTVPIMKKGEYLNRKEVV